MKTKNRKTRMRPAQRDSKMSNGRLSGVFCRWQGGRLPENRPAQRNSEISILKTCSYCPSRPYRPLDFKNTPAQRHSKLSNGRLSGVLCWPHGQNSPPQRDSGISILETRPTGQLAVRLVPQSGDPYCPLNLKTRAAQHDSKISNFDAAKAFSKTNSRFRFVYPQSNTLIYLNKTLIYIVKGFY